MSYRITSNYGWRTHPITKKRSFHAGIDLVKGHNQPIHAFTAGTVLFAGTAKQGTGLGGYGRVVVIKDHKDRVHIYAHLNQVTTHKGAYINKGDTIGTQGATGNVTGSHLHYEVRKKASPSYGWTNKPQHSTLNPKPFIQQKGGQRVVKKIKEDGLEGKNTIKREQQFFNTPQDGKISRPSLLIKARQTFLNKYGNANLKVDGLEGIETIKAEQRFHGTPVDGIISRPSLLIKERQKFLNKYGQ